MKIGLRHVFLLATVFFGMVSAGRAQLVEGQVQWLGGDLPPYMWDNEQGQPKGYGAELIVAMAERLERKPDIAFLPWARAVKTAQEGASFGALPLLRSPDREANFRWVILLDHVKYTFFARSQDNNLAPRFIQSLDELRDKRVGVLRGSPIIKRLQAENFTKISEDTGYIDLLRRLESGAIDAVYAGYPMLSAAISQSGIAPDRFIAGTSLGDGDLYMATGLNVSAAEVDAWTKAYAALQRHGVVAKLRAKYGLSKLP